MNLVLSGPIDDSLLNAVRKITKPGNIVTHHLHAVRLERVDQSAISTNSVEALCADARVDHAYVESGLQLASFGLLAMDMDSTLITIECIDEIADYAGKKSEVAAITEAAMRGEITNFAESLKKRVALLAGIDANVLARVFDERLSLSPGAEQLISAARAAGLQTLLVSGGFTYFTDRLVETLHLNAGHGNVLETVDQRLTGQVAGPIIDGQAKANIVRDMLNELGLSTSEGLVIGDGSNDLPMMQLVSHSISYHGKPSVVRAARYAVRYGSLETVLDFLT